MADTNLRALVEKGEPPVTTASAVSPAVARPARTRSTRTRSTRTPLARREARAGWLFISPWLVGFAIFTAGAMIFSLVLTFGHYDITTNTVEVTGLDNLRALLADPKVATSLGNTLFYAVLAVPLEIVVALGLALLLARAPRGSGIFRTLFYLPKMTPAVATAAMFFLLLNGNTGAVNQALRAIGIHGPQWLVDPAWVKPSIVMMSLWAVSGTMVIFLAALRNVPRELYEASALDGAGGVRTFRSITLPMISGAMFFNVIVLTIAAFQIFDSAYLLFWRDNTNTSPDASLFYAIYLFQKAFRQFDLGFAAAMAWVMFVVIMLVTLVQVRVGDRFVYYEGEKP